jgi:hypothetical protein
MGHGAKAADVFLTWPLAVAGHSADCDILLVDIQTSPRLRQPAQGGFLAAARRASPSMQALRRLRAADQAPLRAPREGATSGGAVKMRVSDSAAGMAPQRLPDDGAATWLRQHTAVPSYFHGSWCMKVHEEFCCHYSA